METMFKRGQFIVMRLRSLLAAAGHDPDDYIPLVDGGCLLSARESKGGVVVAKPFFLPISIISSQKIWHKKKVIF